MQNIGEGDRVRMPPLAITGIETASETARVNSMSKPLRVPSWSTDVSNISPTPVRRIGEPSPERPDLSVHARYR